MSTYNPPSFPRRPKQPTYLSEIRYKFEVAYYRYSVNTALYVMSPGEKLAFNLIVLSALSLFLWAVWWCAVWWCVPCSALMSCVRKQTMSYITPSSFPNFNPQTIDSYVGADFFGRIFGQMSSLDVAKGSFQHPGEAVASLQEYWRTDNTSTVLAG